MSKKYTKDFIIKEIAARASFTANDVKIIWSTFERLVEEMVADGDVLMIGGLFKMYIKETKTRKIYDFKKKECVDYGTTYRLVISPSSTLRNIIKRKNKQLEPPSEEE